MTAEATEATETMGVQAATETQASGLPLQADERWGGSVTAPDRTFWTALAVCALLHAGLFITAAKSVPRDIRIGDANGADDAINVSLVSEGEIRSMTEVTPEPPPAGLALKPTEAPEVPKPEEPKPKEEKPEKAKPETAKPDAEEPAPDAIRPSLADDAANTPHVLEIPEEARAPEKKAAPAKPKPKPEQQAKPQPKAEPQQKIAKLDLTPPPNAFTGAGGAGKSAGFERPPGITQSGANDQFARDVIHELKRTMPSLGEIYGRVTVRIILQPNGNVADVQVIRPSGRPGIDPYVVFAAQHAAYPFPPPNSKDVDRVFVVTYIYN